MSYIDQFRHELVGMLGGLPVYRPLEDIVGDEDPAYTGEFSCTTCQLVIGGGGGEFPGLVVKKPVCAVATFLSAELADMEELAKERPGLPAPPDWTPIIEDYLFQPDILD